MENKREIIINREEIIEGYEEEEMEGRMEWKRLIGRREKREGRDSVRRW